MVGDSEDEMKRINDAVREWNEGQEGLVHVSKTLLCGVHRCKHDTWLPSLSCPVVFVNFTEEARMVASVSGQPTKAEKKFVIA